MRVLNLALIPILASVASLAQGQIRYRVADIDADLRGFYSSVASSEALGINDMGQVCGEVQRVSGNRRGFVWQNGVVTDIGILSGGNASARAINNSGMAAGTANGGTTHAVTWENGTLTNIAPALGAHLQSFANAISASGAVAGNYHITGGAMAYLYDHGQVTILRNVEGNTSVEVHGMNDHRVVVGQTNFDGAGPRGVVWRNEVLAEQLAILPGFRNVNLAYDVNNNGLIVGSSVNTERWFATAWQNNVPINLGNLPGGQHGSFGYAVNDLGQIVGEGSGVGNPLAFLWENGQMKSLNGMLHPDSSDWHLEKAFGINNLGQIVGWGRNGNRVAAFMATPVPEPSGLWALGIGGITFVLLKRGKRRQARLL